MRKKAVAEKPRRWTVLLLSNFILPLQESGGWCVSTFNPLVTEAYKVYLASATRSYNTYANIEISWWVWFKNRKLHFYEL